METKTLLTTAVIYFAGGCFWGTEHFLKKIHGVIETEVGYANGKGENPTYEEVCTDKTGFAETVKVVYNPEELPLTYLLQLFFKAIDPTTLNRQGHDVGTQYRTGIYYTDSAMLPVIRAEMKKLNDAYGGKVVVEVLPLQNFYNAETYHQDYLDKNPTGYCHLPRGMFVLAERANAHAKEERAYKVPAKDKLREVLGNLAFEVTQHGATEPPFDNAYHDVFEKGIYVDAVTGQPLFLSTDKFESGCGWPAFTKPIDNGLLTEIDDHSMGMERVEVRATNSGSHLGHVFEDGPASSGGLRYCINSAALRFVPLAQMEAQGYGKYVPMLDDVKPVSH